MDRTVASALPLAVRLFGDAAIEEEGRPLTGRAGHRHPLALLALLSTAPGRRMSRDKLVSLLWPEADPGTVRHRLSVTVYDLRQALGRKSVASVQDGLRLDTEVAWVDVARFEDACEAGDLDTAIDLYRGPFLDGFHLPDSVEFDAWTGAERERLARLYARALEGRAREAEQLGDRRGAARSWRRLVEQDPYSVPATLGLMRALEADGKRAEALRAAERHAQSLRTELGVAPDEDVAELADRLRDSSGDGNETAPPIAAATAGSPETVPRIPVQPAPRKWRWLVAAVVAIGLMLFGLRWLPRSSTAPEAAVDDRIVILPFVVRGSPEIEYLGDGMAEILGTTLDGGGPLRTADARAVLGFVRSAKLDPSDPAAGRRAASHFGASRFVLGTILEREGQMMVQATLYDREGRVEARATASSGDDARFFEMVDGISRQLLVDADEGTDRMTRLAASTSSSLSALKAWLEGESHLRAGAHQLAAESFRQATAIDSTFALAWYRLAVAAEWSFLPYEAQDAVEQAVRFADRLPERERLLLVGWQAYARGEADRSERIYRRVIDLYPEEVEAWLQLGEIRFHYAPSRGRSIDDSRAAFEKVLELEPDHDDARTHLARIFARRGDRAALERVIAPFLRSDVDGPDAVEMRALRAWTAGDRAAIAQVERELTVRDSYDLIGVLLGLFYSENVDGVAWSGRLLAAPDRPVEVQTAGHTVIALTELARGRLRAANLSIDRAAEIDPLRGAELRAIAATLPFLPADPGMLERARQTLASSSTLAGDSFFLPDPDSVRPHLSVYLKGLLAARFGQQREALEAADRLEQMRPISADLPLARDLADGVRAEVHLASGRPAAALAVLERAGEHPGYQLVLPSPFHPRIRERYLKARLLGERKRFDEALGLYRTIGARSVYDLAYLAPSRLEMARIHEEAGQDRLAIESYRRFIALWSDADPELQIRVVEARERLTTLASRSAPTGLARARDDP